MAERNGRWSTPATTPEQREQQLVLLATDLVEQRLREGVASAQEVTYILKLGTEREKLEREKLARENHKLRAQTEAVEADKKSGEMYEKALQAMRSYQGFTEEVLEEDVY